jgi:hypothetical protein
MVFPIFPLSILADTSFVLKYLICHCTFLLMGGHMVFRYPFKMGRQKKWKIVMGLEVQDPKDKSMFSSKDLTWTEVYRPDSPLFDHVARIPLGRVPDFIRGEESNPDAPCTFLPTVKKNPAQRDNAHKQYEL